MKLASFVLCALLFNFAAAAVGECDVSPLGYACMKKMADYYNLHWTLQGDLLHAALEGLGNETFPVEWVGLCFPERAGNMAPADAVIGWIDVNGASVLPYRIVERSVFAEDEDPFVTLVNVTATEDENGTIVRFTRALTQGRVRVRTDREIPINFAVGDTDGLKFHRGRGSGTVDLGAELGDGRTAAFVPTLIPSDTATVPETSTESMPAPEKEPEVATEEETDQQDTSLTTAPTAEAPSSIEAEDLIETMLDNLG